MSEVQYLHQRFSNSRNSRWASSSALPGPEEEGSQWTCSEALLNMGNQATESKGEKEHAGKASQETVFTLKKNINLGAEAEAGEVKVERKQRRTL